MARSTNKREETQTIILISLAKKWLDLGALNVYYSPRVSFLFFENRDEGVSLYVLYI